jgi:hypothetical protein
MCPSAVQLSGDGKPPHRKNAGINSFLARAASHWNFEQQQATQIAKAKPREANMSRMTINTIHAGLLHDRGLFRITQTNNSLNRNIGKSKNPIQVRGLAHKVHGGLDA